MKITMTITRDGEDYEVELYGMSLQLAEPEVGVPLEYRDVTAWNDELGVVVLTNSEDAEALQLLNDELEQNPQSRSLIL